MNNHSQFLRELAYLHKMVDQDKTDDQIGNWAKKIISILFPTSTLEQLPNQAQIEKSLNNLKGDLVKFISSFPRKRQSTPQYIADYFFNILPEIFEDLKKDAYAIQMKDPKMMRKKDVYKHSLSFRALCYHRIAKQLSILNEQAVAKLIADAGYNQTSIDIQPQCMIHQGVMIHPGTTIAGSNTVIGSHSNIGGNIWISQSISPFSQVSFHSGMVPLIADSIQQLIGNTPMIEIKKIFKHPKIKIYAKLEGNNPCGSVKDRPAFNMINQAFKRGDIKPGMKLIEVTSGNTGIALAMVASLFQIQLQLVMPNTMSQERTKTMQAFGAKVVLLPPDEDLKSLKLYAEQKVKTGKYFQLNQFNNPDNYMAHYKTTGPEIYRDTLGKVTHFVASTGTTGTCMGVSRYLKEQNPNIKIVGIRPALNNKIAGMVRWSPEYQPQIFEKKRLDMMIDITEEESVQMARRLAREQCIFAGHSSGSSIAAAVRLARTLEEGVIVAIICDRGDRYLSTSLFG